VYRSILLRYTNVFFRADRAGSGSGAKWRKQKEGQITICVGRPGKTEEVNQQLSKSKPSDSFLVTPGEALDVSSSKIREVFFFFFFFFF